MPSTFLAVGHAVSVKRAARRDPTTVVTSDPRPSRRRSNSVASYTRGRWRFASQTADVWSTEGFAWTRAATPLAVVVSYRFVQSPTEVLPTEADPSPSRPSSAAPSAPSSVALPRPLPWAVALRCGSVSLCVLSLAFSTGRERARGHGGQVGAPQVRSGCLWREWMSQEPYLPTLNRGETDRVRIWLVAR